MNISKYSPFGPYFSKWTLTCSRVSPVFSFTPKLFKTSVADLVCAFSILVDWAFRWSDRNAWSLVTSIVALGEGRRRRRGGWNSSNFHRWTLEAAECRSGLLCHLSPLKEEKKKAPDPRYRRCWLLCWSTAAATSSPSEGVLCLCRGGPPPRCWALPPALQLDARTWADGSAGLIQPLHEILP